MYLIKDTDEGNKYLAQLTPRGDASQGCYRKDSDSLDSIREWAKRLGKPGDVLFICRNGAAHLSRTITL